MVEDLLQKVCSADRLPSLSAVAVEVLRLSRTDDASIDDLAKVMAQDPAMTSKMLKTVNSALFSLPREIGSLKQAVGLLGLRSVKVMALSFSLVEAMRGDEGEFDYNTFWQRSLSSAVAGRLMAKAVIPQLAEECFVAGLLSDMGMIALWRCVPESYQPVLQACGEEDRELVEIETEQLGVTHARIGQELLQNWNLPTTLCSAVGAHHGEGLDKLSGDAQKLAQVVFAATTIAGLFCQDIRPSELDRAKAACHQASGIDAAGLEEILETLDHHVRDTASMLSVQIGQTVDYAQIQADAAAQLAELSMQAEIERVDASQREMEARTQVDQLNDERKAILEVASTDGLTKIANRAAFDKRLAEEFERAQSQGSSIGLIMLDLDHFKLCNDIHGHQAGDEVLRHVASSLKEVVQHVGFAARYGGEEFAVIVAQKAAQEIQELAENIRKTIADRPVKLDDEELRVTASLGAACIASASSSTVPEQLIKDADQHLYRAKHGGRNRVEM